MGDELDGRLIGQITPSASGLRESQDGVDKHDREKLRGNKWGNGTDGDTQSHLC